MEDKNIEGLIEEKDDHEKEKISLPEGIFMVLIALSADIFEIVGILLTIFTLGAAAVIGIAAYIYGLIISALIAFWAVFRGAKGRMAIKMAIKRLIAVAIGGAADAATGGIWPIRSIVLVITIWLNNKFSDKELGRIAGILEKVSKIA